MPGPGAIRTMDPWRPPLPPRPAASAEDGIPSLVGRAAVCTGLLGLALGIWCRSFSEGSGGLVGVGLAQLGAPWVLVAFAAGVLVAAHGRLIPPSSGPPSRWAAWRVPARWSSRRSATTATPRPPRPCSGRPPGCWSAGRRVSPAPRGGPDPVRGRGGRGRGSARPRPRRRGDRPPRLRLVPLHRPGWPTSARGGWSPPASPCRSCSPEVGPPASWPRSRSSCWPPPSPPSSSWPPTASASPDRRTAHPWSRLCPCSTAPLPTCIPTPARPSPGDRPSSRPWWSAAPSSGPSATSPWGTSSPSLPRQSSAATSPPTVARRRRTAWTGSRPLVGRAIRATCSAWRTAPSRMA